jgi:hypothetical protein
MATDFSGMGAAGLLSGMLAQAPQAPQHGGQTGLGSSDPGGEGATRGKLTEAQRKQYVASGFWDQQMHPWKMSAEAFDNKMASQAAGRELGREQAQMLGMAQGRVPGMELSPTEQAGMQWNAYNQAQGGATGQQIGQNLQGIQRQDMLNEATAEAKQLEQTRYDAGQKLRDINYKTAESNLRKADMQLEQARTGNTPLTNTDRFAMTGTLRDDFQQATSDMREGLLARDQAVNLIDQGDAVGATLAITKIAKAADPGSTVRVEEGRLVGESTGLVRSLMDNYNKMSGEGFTPESKVQFMAALDNLSRPLADEYRNIAEAYGATAERGGINVDDIYMGQYDPERVGQLGTLRYQDLPQQ